MTDASPDPPPPDEGWNRLHPLTPIARVGRLAPALVLLLVVSNVHSKAENGTAETDYLDRRSPLLSAVYGYIHWMVTRWRFEGDTLRIETGLIRKDSRRLPLARIQAVDIVRPFLARLLGVSELRIRLAGSGSTDGKLAYLSEAQAAELRLVLLAGTGGRTPKPPWHPPRAIPARTTCSACSGSYSTCRTGTARGRCSAGSDR